MKQRNTAVRREHYPTQDVDTSRRSGRSTSDHGRPPGSWSLQGRTRRSSQYCPKKTNDSGLKLNPKKCVFRKTELTYFGHLIGGDGIKSDPERVEALLELSRPSSVSELRTVYGQVRVRYVANDETNDCPTQV